MNEKYIKSVNLSFEYKLIETQNILLFQLMKIAQEESIETNELQQFRQHFENSAIIEWSGAYINYPSIQYYLFYLKNIYDRNHHAFFQNCQLSIDLGHLSPKTQSNIQIALGFIYFTQELGQNKMQKFIKYKTNEIIHLWSQLLQVVISTQLSEIYSYEYFAKKPQIKQLLKIIYANILYLQEFIDLNKKIIKCIINTKRKYVLPFIQKQKYSPLEQDHNQLEQHTNKSQIDQQINHSDESKERIHFQQLSFKSDQELLKNIDAEQQEEEQSIAKIKGAVKSLYSTFTFLNKNVEIKLEEYARFKLKETSNKNYFLLGLYIGLGFVILVSLILMLVLNFLSFEYDQAKIQSMNYIFPMFRGVGLLILYLWGMAWNVYGFIQYKINFKTILEYGTHYSTHFQIMKRAGFFTLIYCLMLFMYLIGLSLNNNSGMRLPIQYTPLVVWLCYFLYIFFPSRQLFNPKGRRYFYLIVKKIALTPFVQMTFLLSYATDQAVSFVVPIKDFAYTICFYTSEFQVDDIKSCLNSGAIDGIIIAYIVAIIPLILRMIQCFNQARQSSGKFFGHLQMWNFFKYMASFMTSTISFLSSKYSGLLPFFIISSIISTLYSYYWDLKNDWGLLQKGSKHRFLRNNLCYRNPMIYYVVICVNLIFRCSWTLTISPSLVLLVPNSPFLPFVTGLIQIFRRCMWNFIRVEKQQVINCASFTIIKEKPAQILQRLKRMKESKSIKLVEDQSIIQYAKVTNEHNFDFYKKFADLQLPNVSKEMVDRQYQSFLQVYREEDAKIGDYQKEIKGQILYNLNDKYY